MAVPVEVSCALLDRIIAGLFLDELVPTGRLPPARCRNALAAAWCFGRGLGAGARLECSCPDGDCASEISADVHGDDRPVDVAFSVHASIIASALRIVARSCRRSTSDCDTEHGRSVSSVGRPEGGTLSEWVLVRILQTAGSHAHRMLGHVNVLCNAMPTMRVSLLYQFKYIISFVSEDLTATSKPLLTIPESVTRGLWPIGPARRARPRRAGSRARAERYGLACLDTPMGSG